MKAAAFLMLLCGALDAGLPDAGQPSPWLKLGLGSRELAMGRAGTALAGDIYAFHYNPATLGTLERVEFGSQASLLPGDRSMEHLSVGRPVTLGGRRYAWGLSLTHFGLNAPIEFRVHNSPEPEKTFLFSDYAAMLGLAGWNKGGNFSLGLNLRVLSSQLGEATATGISTDLGALFRPRPWLDLGLCLQDLAGRLSWSTGYAESYPLSFRLGASVRPLEGLIVLSAEAERGASQELRLRGGAEFWAMPDRFALRAGMMQGLWTAGFGIKAPLWSNYGGLDYAVSADPLEPGALAHRLSLNLSLKMEKDDDPAP